ncbi:MFS transporter [Fimbriiglobus ruber]|uniref:MFS permease n=1 Tax=Fimbriiglobus ruber TaxID=1908690 RepID=A0A225DN97_9BACT|nr:MFS transporter [Fimbriiglobus ruber]OWK37657.1 MFS permease [Fimbriiglobus ruber]
MPGADSPPLPAAPTYKSRAFAWFWWARVLSTLAVQAESATIGWQVYTIARDTRTVEESAFLVGMVGLAQFVPLFALTFLAGATADRCDRRAILLVCTGVEIVCAVVLATFSLDPNPSLAPVFVVAVLFGASRAFLSPASGAMGPMLVSRDALPRAISRNSLGDQIGAVIGPWVGGVLCAVSPAAAYGGSAALYALAVVALLAVRANTRPEHQPGSRLELIREGIVYVWTNKVVLGAISLDLFTVLLGGATALLPVYASDVLQVGADGFGILRSGPAVGAAVMACALAWRPLRHRAGRWMFAGVAAFGAATLVFAVSESLVVSVVALATLGAADMISVYVRQSLVQVVTPDAMRGRVSAVSGLFIGASAELGEFETGVAARILGPVGAAIFGGIGSLAVAGAWFWMFPSLRKADRLDGTETCKSEQGESQEGPQKGTKSESVAIVS